MTHGRSKSASTLLITMTMLAGTTVGSLAAGMACESFDVVSDGSKRAVEFVDVNNDGPGVGDYRIGARQLLNADGNPVGETHWTLLLMNSVAGAAPLTSIQWIFMFEDGEIYSNAVGGGTKTAGETGHPSLSSFRGPVSGGTGAFKGASGVFDGVIDGQTITFTFDLSCD
ncbi:hypothetical protein AAFN47_00490 [Hoeflea sp. CAU 1731]